MTSAELTRVRLLDVAQLALFAAAGPFFIFPSTRFVAAFLLLPLVFALNLTLRRPILTVTPFNPALLLFCVMLLVSILATTDLTASLPKISGVLYGVGAFFLLAQFTRRSKAWTLGLLLTILAGFGLTILALPGTQWNSKLFMLDWLTSHLPRRFVELPGAQDGFHPVEVAGALLWTIPLTLSAAWAALIRAFPFRPYRGSTVGAGALLLILLFEFAVFIFAQSRAAYLGLGAAVLLVFLLLLQIRLGWTRFAVLIAGFGALSGGVILALWEKIAASVSNLFTQFGQSLLSLGTLGTRQLIWAGAVTALKDFQVTGMGMNRFREVFFLLYPTIGMQNTRDLGHAHNELLQAGLDLGVPGLVAFIAIYLVSFAMLYQIYRCTRRPGTQWIVLGLSASLLTHFLFGLVDAVSLGAKPGLLFWLLLGLVAGLYQQVFAPEAGE
jgi:putative inorganic carbon (HCO3(-)) transporter